MDEDTDKPLILLLCLLGLMVISFFCVNCYEVYTNDRAIESYIKNGYEQSIDQTSGKILWVKIKDK